MWVVNRLWRVFWSFVLLVVLVSSSCFCFLVVNSGNLVMCCCGLFSSVFSRFCQCLVICVMCGLLNRLWLQVRQQLRCWLRLVIFRLRLNLVVCVLLVMYLMVILVSCWVCWNFQCWMLYIIWNNGLQVVLCGGCRVFIRWLNGRFWCDWLLIMVCCICFSSLLMFICLLSWQCSIWVLRKVLISFLFFGWMWFVIGVLMCRFCWLLQWQSKVVRVVVMVMNMVSLWVVLKWCMCLVSLGFRLKWQRLFWWFCIGGCGWLFGSLSSGCLLFSWVFQQLSWCWCLLFFSYLCCYMLQFRYWIGNGFSGDLWLLRKVLQSVFSLWVKMFIVQFLVMMWCRVIIRQCLCLVIFIMQICSNGLFLRLKGWCVLLLVRVCRCCWWLLWLSVEKFCQFMCRLLLLCMCCIGMLLMLGNVVCRVLWCSIRVCSVVLKCVMFSGLFRCVRLLMLQVGLFGFSCQRNYMCCCEQDSGIGCLWLMWWIVLWLLVCLVVWVVWICLQKVFSLLVLNSVCNGSLMLQVWWVCEMMWVVSRECLLSLKKLLCRLICGRLSILFQIVVMCCCSLVCGLMCLCCCQIGFGSVCVFSLLFGLRGICVRCINCVGIMYFGSLVCSVVCRCWFCLVFVLVLVVLVQQLINWLLVMFLWIIIIVWVIFGCVSRCVWIFFGLMWKLCSLICWLRWLRYFSILLVFQCVWLLVWYRCLLLVENGLVMKCLVFSVGCFRQLWVRFRLLMYSLLVMLVGSRLNLVFSMWQIMLFSGWLIGECLLFFVWYCQWVMLMVVLVGLQWLCRVIVGRCCNMWLCSFVGSVLLLENRWCRLLQVVMLGLLMNSCSSGGMKCSVVILNCCISFIRCVGLWCLLGVVRISW